MLGFPGRAGDRDADAPQQALVELAIAGGWIAGLLLGRRAWRGGWGAPLRRLRRVDAVARYLRLLAVQLRASTALALQYRLEFLGQGALALLWTGWSLVPLLVVFGDRPGVAGWTFEEALVVMGWFTLMKGVLEGAVNPSLASVVEHIRKGTLDFVLLKPADAQFLVSTARFLPWRIVDVRGRAGHLRGGLPPDGALAGAGRGGGGAGAAGLRHAGALLALDPGDLGRLLPGQDRQPLLPLLLHLRRRALAGRRLPRLPALPLHLRGPAGAAHQLPGAGAARADPAGGGAPGAGRFAPFVAPRVVWPRAIARYTSASS